MDLERIFQPILAELDLVDARLRASTENISGDTGGILSRIVTHPFAVPGKRIRPALVLLAFRSLGGTMGREASGNDLEAVAHLAAAVELLHAASLVHDDIIDGADSRRHQVSLNKLFGNRVAVLAGDILYTHFFSLVTELPSVSSEIRFALLGLFLRTTKDMCLGEILAQEAGPGPLGFEAYLKIAEDKTASLFSACCEAAALVGGASEASVRSLREFGLAFGLAFQIADDIVDGDHGLDPSFDLRPEAGKYAEIARGIALALPLNEYSLKLGELVDYVIGQIIP
jgi:geranylgeranyl pyrophosphate synthase